MNKKSFENQFLPTFKEEENDKNQQENRLKETDKSNKDSNIENRIVSVAELGKVSYQEKIINLSEHRKIETGIDHIRRKTVKLIDLYENIKSIRYGTRDIDTNYFIGKKEYPSFHNARIDALESVFSALSENKYPNLRLWNHRLAGDISDFTARHSIARFKSQGLFFQKVIPAERIRFKEGIASQKSNPFFLKERGKIIVDENQEQRIESAIKHYINKDTGYYDRFEFKDSKNELLEYDLSVSNGNNVYGGLEDSADSAFFFGAKNPMFVKYIDSILSNPETLKMLELHDWEVNKPISLTKRESLKTQFYVPEKEHSRKNIDYLKFLIQGLPVNIPGHPLLPIVLHPNIPRLRWCHAEMGALITKKNLNILFFETLKKSKK